MANTAEYIYRIQDRYSGAIQRIKRNTDKFKASVASTSVALSGMDKTLRKTGQKLTGIGQNLLTKVTLPIVGLGLASIKTAVDMQSGFIGVQKTVNASAKQFRIMRKEFEQMSTRIPVSVDDLYKLGESAGQLGIKTENIISFTETMAKLAATTNIAGEEGASQLARFANITGMSQDNFDRLGSTIVHLGNNLATTEAEISDMALRLAGSANVVGMAEHEILALAAAAKSVGLNAEAGGTAFSRVMLKINDAVASGGKELSMFAKISGKTSKEFADNFKNNASGAIVDFTEGLGDLQKRGVNITGILDKLEMSDIRVRDSLLRASGAGDVFRRSLEMGSLAWQENTALNKEAELRFKSWGSQLIIAWNRIKLVSNAIGEILAPMVIGLSNFLLPLIEKFGKMSRATKIFVITLAAFAAIIPPLLIGIGMLALSVGAISLPFLAVGAAITSVSFAITQLIANWKALSAPGFLKDLGGWAFELMGGNAMAQSSGAIAAQEKAKGRSRNNQTELTGKIDVTATGNAKVKRAEIGLNTGTNLAGAY